MFGSPYKLLTPIYTWSKTYLSKFNNWVAPIAHSPISYVNEENPDSKTTKEERFQLSRKRDTDHRGCNVVTKKRYSQYDLYDSDSATSYENISKSDEKNQLLSGNDIDHILLVERLIRSYQMRGHYVAQLDPLELKKFVARWPMRYSVKDRKFRHYAEEHINLVKLVEQEVPLDKLFKLPATTRIGGAETTLPLGDIVARLEQAYCRTIGIEYMFINSFYQCDFIRQKFEEPRIRSLSKDQKRLLLARLGRTHAYEDYLNTKFPGTNSFGLAGCEVLTPCIKTIMDRSTDFGIEHFIVGMGHRGRTNLLANIFQVPLVNIISLFNRSEPSGLTGGDVKHHLGVDTENMNRVTNKRVRLTMLTNPAHLECVNAIALGRTKAEQILKRDFDGNKVLAVLIHGDAAFSGQGLCYELMNLSDLPGFTTHGTIHIVVNNQIGFTTDATAARSQPYSSDVGRVVNAPIFHVNGDDPEAVTYVANVAAEWRNTFKSDVVIEIVSYRRHGHFDDDEPSFTQPFMYAKIGKTPPIFQKYASKLVQEGLVDDIEIRDFMAHYKRLMDQAVLKATQKKSPNISIWLDAPSMSSLNKINQPIPTTGITEEDILHLGNIHSAYPPENFVVHKLIADVLRTRKRLRQQRMIDWSSAEAIALGSLLKEGTHVRFTGLDVERGAICHRHFVLHHQTVEGLTYIPLQHVAPKQAIFSIHNSPMAELSVLGFEVGYAQCQPNNLVIWEAQYGDFASMAQCMFDQFISTGETKWAKQTGLVVNLPHGLEAAEPDHASCKPERYLQACNDDPDEVVMDYEQQMLDTNWIVTYVTTAANVFHLYRRQILMPYRKPLINITPKSRLFIPISESGFDEIKSGTSFMRVIPDAIQDHSKVKKVVFSCGRVYFDFANTRREFNKHREIALIRIEQPAPFPYDLVKKEIDKYPNASFIFGQEEPKNMGFQQYCCPRLQRVLGSKELKLVCRPASSTPTSGYPSKHKLQLNKLKKDIIDS